MSGDFVFGEAVNFPRKSLKRPAQVAHYFAFSTTDKVAREFQTVSKLREFAATVGIDSLPEFKNRFADAEVVPSL